MGKIKKWISDDRISAMIVLPFASAMIVLPLAVWPIEIKLNYLKHCLFCYTVVHCQKTNLVFATTTVIKV